MDGGGDGGLAAWLIDAGAAVLFAAAVAFAGNALVGPQAAAIGGSGGFVLALLFLRSVKAEGGVYRLPAFDLAEWEEPGETQQVLELTELEPLLLVDALTVPTGSRVVQLFSTPPLPSPGEMKARIDAHLAGQKPEGEVVRLPVDASAALREALADLRRSLG